MNRKESEAFLAARPPEGAPVENKAASKPRRPTKSSHPWRGDRAYVQALADGMAKIFAAGIASRDAAIAALQERVAELEQVRGVLAPVNISLSAYDEHGECVAEFRQRGSKVTARAGGAHFASTGTVDQLAAELLRFFRANVGE